MFQVCLMWRVLHYFSKAAANEKERVRNMNPHATKTIVLSTDGLGSGVNLLAFRHVLSSALQNSAETEGGDLIRRMRIIRRSLQQVIQEGGRSW